VTDPPRPAAPKPDPAGPWLPQPPQSSAGRGFPVVDSGPPKSPRSSGRPVLIGILVVAVVVIGAYLLFLRTPGDQVSPTAAPTTVAAGSPTPTPASPSMPSPTPAASSSTGPATAAATAQPTVSEVPTPGSGGPSATDLPIDPAIAASIREVIAGIPELRELDELAEVPFRFVGQEQFEREFAAMFMAENPAQRVAAEDELLTRLGFLSPEQDLQELILSLYSSQVAAFYDPLTGAFTVIVREGFDFGADDRIIVAHEYTHALQDQHYDLEATQVNDPAEGDQALAQLALIEGDATALMFDWATQNLSFEELLEVGGADATQDQAILDSMPPVLQRQITFPYFDGCSFVNTIRAGMGYDAVDAAYGDRPASTEQILHPEKYESGEPPIAVELPEIATALGTGWTDSYRQTMGEMLIDVWVREGVIPAATLPCFSPAVSDPAAAGWGGDRLVNLDGPDGSWAVYWATVWDSSTDAVEFLAAAEAAMADLSFSHEVGGASDPTDPNQPLIVVRVASDAATLAQLERVLDPG